MTRLLNAIPIVASRLIGECNRCGLCCTPNGLRCEFLAVDGKIGEAGASRCTIYTRRIPGMPISLLDKHGRVAMIGACTHGTSVDDDVIRQYIGKGCVLREPIEQEVENG